jgi:SAM-dependent methyltransferase
MDEMREEMRTRWNSDGWHYDETPAHGINDPDDRDKWLKLFSMCPKGTKMLDVGTGTGFAALIAAECGLDVTGADWSETMLSLAQAKAERGNHMVNWVQTLTETLPFPNNCFDLISARHVMWTLVEPVKAFAEWFRVLKPGGKVYADYAPRKGDAGQHYRIETEQRLPLNRDVSAETIASLFREADFTDVLFSTHEKQIKHEDHIHHKKLIMFTCVK